MCQITGQDREQKIGNGKGHWERNFRPSFRKENTTSESNNTHVIQRFLENLYLKQLLSTTGYVRWPGPEVSPGMYRALQDCL